MAPRDLTPTERASIRVLGLVDHSAYELLVDPKGKGRVRYDSAVRPGPVVADIRAAS